LNFLRVGDKIDQTYFVGKMEQVMEEAIVDPLNSNGNLVDGICSMNDDY